jgi:predicted NAD/FAD-binding protein
VKVAIVGSGVAGLTVAHHLQREHELTVFEASARVGGHVHTRELKLEGRRVAVDTGFIVFNDWTYPDIQDRPSPPPRCLFFLRPCRRL